MTFNTEQVKALNILNSGVNTFITGGAGVGKTAIIKEFIEIQSKQGKSIMITAPTGIAAIGLGGVTLSRAFDIPFGVLTYRYKELSANEEVVNSDIIIIDEISMCRVDTFEFVCNKITNANERRRYMGKSSIQLVVVGDFFQLPPVMQSKEKILLDKYYGKDIGLGFAFISKFWKMFRFYNIMLNKVERQHNETFIENLNKVREGNKAYIEHIVSASSPNKIVGGIELCGKNSEVLEVNTRELNKLPGVTVKYTAVKTGEASEMDVIADEELLLKLGARVMVLTNMEGASNGTLGEVIGLYNDGVEVKLDTGNVIAVGGYTWDIHDYKIEEVNGEEKLTMFTVGTFTQIPLKLAYAITIHKSQGQTYDKVNISPYCWECGQLYVAISRARDISNIYFNYKPDMKYIVISLNVVKFYNSLVLDVEEPVQKAKVNMDDDMLKIINSLNNIGE